MSGVGRRMTARRWFGARLAVAAAAAAPTVLPARALAHGASGDAPGWLPQTPGDALVLASLVATAAVYARGVSRLWRTAGIGHGTSRAGAGCFAAGWLALAVALASPLHPLGQVLFAAHMAQHEILMLVAAPLLVLARPGVPLLWGASPALRHGWQHLARLPATRRVWRLVTLPAVAFALQAVALWVWHVPALFDATLNSDAVHAAQHVSFLGSALLFWWVLVHARQRAVAYGAAVASLFATSLQGGMLGALLTVAPRSIYPTYERTAPARGWTALEDQQLGGLLMWIPAGVLYMVAALALLAGWLRESERGRALASRTARIRAMSFVACSLASLLGLTACDGDGVRQATASGGVAAAQDTLAPPLAYVSNERDGTVSVIDTGTGVVIASLPVGGRPRGIRAGRTGERVYVAVSAQSWVREPFPEAIVVIDARSQTIARRIPVGKDPEQFVVTPDEGRLVTANEESATASITDLARDATIAVLPVGIEPEGVAISPDGSVAYVTAETTNTVSVIDVARAEVVHAFLVDARPRDAVFAPDGKRAYVSAEIAGTVAVVDTARHEVIGAVAMPDGQAAVGLAISPDGTQLWVANGHANRVTLVDTRTPRLVTQIAVGYRPWGVALSADGSRLYTADGVSNQLSVIDTAARAVVATIPVGDRPWGIAIAPPPAPAPAARRAAAAVAP